jgi:hypothetical protein
MLQRVEALLQAQRAAAAAATVPAAATPAPESRP